MRVRLPALNRLILVGAALQLICLGVVAFVLRPIEVREDIDGGLSEDCLMIATAADAVTAVDRATGLAEHAETTFALYDRDWSRIAGTGDAPPIERLQRAQDGEVFESDIGNRTIRGQICDIDDGQHLFVGREVKYGLGSDDFYGVVIAMALVTFLLLLAVLAMMRKTERRYGQVSAFAQKVVAENLDERLEIDPTSGSFGRLCAQINAMLDRIAMLVEELRYIGDDIGHELRTPLTRMRGRLQRLCESDLPENSQLECDSVIEQVDRSLRTVDAIMRLRQIGRDEKRSAFEKLDLATLVEDLGELYAPAFEAQGRRLVTRVDERFTILGDADLLNEALSNLLGNALKHAEAHGEVILGLSRDEEGPVLWVADGGHGLDPNHARRVFERFERGKGQSGMSGQGLGLPIARAIANLHGLELAAERDANGRLNSFAMRRPVRGEDLAALS